jgi:Holliday junction resolvasome RuvABC endonuclease subunit
MSGILGAHLQVRGGRYVAGFAWVEGGKVRAEPTLSAPAEADRGLSELYQRALELARRHPARLALLKNEAIRAPATLRIAARAEGVVIAAAQQMQIPGAEWAGAGLFKPAGLTKGKGVTAKMAVEELVSASGIKPSDDAQRLAIAVAIAEAMRAGEF